MDSLKHSDKLMHLAAQIDQIARELREVWSAKDISFSAGHQCGVVMMSIQYNSSSLQKLAKRLMEEGK